MNRLARLTLIFALVFAFFILMPPMLNSQFPAYPLMKWADVLDLFTPMVVIPLYWILFQVGPDRSITRREIITFLVLSAFWVEGQGMHLGSNSIGHWIDESLKDTDFYAITYFYDETLGHYLWHIGVMGLSALLIYRQWRNPFVGEPSGITMPVIAGLLYGITYTLMVLEGTTVPLGVPFTVLALAVLLLAGRPHMRQPLILFYTVAYGLAGVVFLVWRLYWGYFREPMTLLR